MVFRAEAPPALVYFRSATSSFSILPLTSPNGEPSELPRRKKKVSRRLTSERLREMS